MAEPDLASSRLGVAKTYKLFIGGKFPRTESGRSTTIRLADGTHVNLCRASRKDVREAVSAARAAQPAWAAASAYLRGQVLYRIAEMLEGRASQFQAELAATGCDPSDARREVAASIDRLVYYAGWADKFAQVMSSVNEVNASYLCFSTLEPTGVVGILAPPLGLLGVVANVAPAVCGGNTCVVLASEAAPLCAISFGEVLHTADVPPGVVNLLTGLTDELAPHLAAHMDVNALIDCTPGRAAELAQLAAENIKRLIRRDTLDWSAAENPYLIADTQEVKTTWHPVGS